MNTRVKICGLTRARDVEAAILHGADMLGFIVEAKSKRRLSVREAARIALPAKGIIPRVAVTVNADDETLSTARKVLRAQPQGQLRAGVHDAQGNHHVPRAARTRAAADGVGGLGGGAS